jgi:hypothetical protein
MPAIGDILREARMRQKIDISEVEAGTKIRAKYLRALENEEFSLLPGGTFVRSFLKTYAEYLGLDAQVIVDEYRATYEPPPETDLQRFASSAPGPRERRYPGPPRRGPLIALGIVGLLAFLLILGVTADDEGGGGEDRGRQTAERGEARERERPRERGRARARAAPARKKRLRLRVVPEGATYVCVDNGHDRVIFEGTIEEARTFRGRRLRINLGRRAVTLHLDGERVPVEPGSTPVGFDFSSRGRTELGDEERPCA